MEYADRRPLGLRFVPGYSEAWIKGQEWPVNIKKRERGEKEKETEKGREMARWKGFGQGVNTYQSEDEEEDEEDENEEDKNEEESEGGEEDSLIQALTAEKEHITSLQQNTGKGPSPVSNTPFLTIDEADQFTADNWIPRSPDLIRLTGKTPLNAEPPLSKLFHAGLITPNEIHYVRSHGPVPYLVWEIHEIEVEGKPFKMDALTQEFESINIPILMACDNVRRKELNMLKHTTGFNWGPGGVGCAYWKGPLLRDVLLAAGVEEDADTEGRRRWVHFEGADEPSEGKYATSIPFEHVMDPLNDVILAYEMNDRPLPPDHGYPVRVMIPGYVGGRCVKWLKKVWTSFKENDSHYHIYDNRMLPSFVTDGQSQAAQVLFRHPDTACYEQILNSVICRPEQGERVPLSETGKYRVAGFAYTGSGHPIRRVEVSLDQGRNWLYCIRRYPDRPIRHGKFWTWVHWYIDIDILRLVQAEGITVRCTDSSKNTQPERPRWNLSGSMNNVCYTVRPEVVQEDRAYVLFRHPVEPANGKEGWMAPSTEVQLRTARQDTTVPQKQFTREEIEKHGTKGDCWIVIDGKVYDATSVLGWHPGGKGPVLGHGGCVHQETTEEYASIHDDYATSKLNGTYFVSGIN